MDLPYRDKKMDRFLASAFATAAIVVIGSLALLKGFDPPMIERPMLYFIQAAVLAVFIIERLSRASMARWSRRYFVDHWFGLILLLALICFCIVTFRRDDAMSVRHCALAAYVLLSAVGKVSRRTLNLASHGKNPVPMMLSTYAILIAAGTLFLLTPRATVAPMRAIDAIFTAASAATLTGLTVREPSFFSPLGLHVIGILMQIGGLIIIIFGTGLAFMVSRAFSLRESATMQDMINMEERSRTGAMVNFIFITTAIIELAGALAMHKFWKVQLNIGGYDGWFVTIFYSVSAFCNGGFALQDHNLVPVRHAWPVYAVILPLIIAGGLGFGVLYNLAAIVKDRIIRFFKRIIYRDVTVFTRPRVRMDLQTKLVLVTTVLLIIIPVVLVLILENNISKPRTFTFTSTQETIFGSPPPQRQFGLSDAFFESVSARTAGLSTTHTGLLSEPSLFVLMITMLIGGSPASTAGGIKTITLALIVVSAVSTLRKRDDVEAYGRSIRVSSLGSALAIVLLFAVALAASSLLLAVTERHSHYDFTQVAFEAASALSTSGLSTGITAALTTGGKVLIIITMLVGRLGALTLLATLTKHTAPLRYDYPEEPVVVG
jgi:trk system potassium uptake protein TrkH